MQKERRIDCQLESQQKKLLSFANISSFMIRHFTLSSKGASDSKKELRRIVSMDELHSEIKHRVGNIQ